MIAKPYEKTVPGADTAILYLHGILGTPDHFRAFLPMGECCSQFSLLLDGHGGDTRDFAHTSMEKWKTQVDTEIRKLLQTHRHLILVAHSMGTLFAIRAAIRWSDRILGIFLLEVPLQIRVRLVLFRSCWKVFRGKIRPDDVRVLAAQKAYGIGQDYRIWRYAGWIPRYLELFREIGAVRRLVPAIPVRCVAFQADCDEMVGAGAADILRKNPGIEVNRLSGSTHFYMPPDEQEAVLRRFSAFLQETRCCRPFPGEFR